VLVSARGVRIHTIDRGSGDPVILLHGVGCNLRNWEPQLKVLEATGGSWRWILVGTACPAGPTAACRCGITPTTCWR
jgi:pimeloyl-ACP methyl ester carboxylesterase